MSSVCARICCIPHGHEHVHCVTATRLMCRSSDNSSGALPIGSNALQYQACRSADAADAAANLLGKYLATTQPKVRDTFAHTLGPCCLQVTALLQRSPCESRTPDLACTCASLPKNPCALVALDYRA